MAETLHVVVLPGGGYEFHAAHEAEPVAAWLVSCGFEASVFRYPVQRRFPEPLDAVRAHVARVRAAGADRVVVLGFSAGGHLAGLTALAPGSRPEQALDGVVLCYPVVSMLAERPVGSRRNLLGLDATDDERRRTSLEMLVRPGAVPFFVWHTVADETVPVEHCYRLGRSLAANGVPHELHVFPHGEHGLGLAHGRPAAAWTRLCERWLGERVNGTP